MYIRLVMPTIDHSVFGIILYKLFFRLQLNVDPPRFIGFYIEYSSINSNENMCCNYIVIWYILNIITQM